MRLLEGLQLLRVLRPLALRRRRRLGERGRTLVLEPLHLLLPPRLLSGLRRRLGRGLVPVQRHQGVRIASRLRRHRRLLLRRLLRRAPPRLGGEADLHCLGLLRRHLAR